MKKKLPLIGLLFLVFFLIGCDTFIVSPLIPQITRSLNIDSGSGGYLVTIYSVFYLVFSPILGPISDRIGRKKMIGIGMIVFSIASVATGLSGNYVLILIARSITGIGAAFAAPNVWSFIGDTFKYEERGKITAIVASALSLGMILGVPIGSALAQWKNWVVSFYVLGILSILVGILIFVIFPTVKPSKAAAAAKYSSKFVKVFKQHNVRRSFIVTFFISFANFGLYTYLGYWLNKCFALEVSTIGLFMIIAGVGNLIGMQVGGNISDKLGKKKVVVVSALIMALSLLLLPIFKANLVLTAVDIFIWLGAGGASFAVMQVFVTQLNPESRGTIMALNNSFMWTGTAIGSALVSLMVKYSSFTVASLICAIGAIAASMTLALFIKTVIDQVKSFETSNETPLEDTLSIADTVHGANELQDLP